MNIIKYLFYTIIGKKHLRPPLTKNQCRQIHFAYRSNHGNYGAQWHCDKCGHSWEYLSPMHIPQ